MPRGKSKKRARKWTPAQHAKFKATMDAQRGVGAPTVSGAVKMDVLVIAKKLEAAIVARITATGKIDEIDTMAIALIRAARRQ